VNQDNRSTNGRLLKVFLSVALAVLTVAVYIPCVHHPFSNYDDFEYVVENPAVQVGLTGQSIRWAFATFDCANWHPVTWLSLQLDSQLFGGTEPFGFHLTNLLLHIANTVLLYLLFVQLTAKIWRSAVVAALFALHPLHVESVAWVTERKDVLSTLFWILTIAAYLFYLRKPSAGRYLLIVATLAVGLMAKPMLVTLPFVLLLLDYWPLRRWRNGGTLNSAAEDATTPLPQAVPFRKLLVEKLPLFALVSVSCVITVLAQSQSGAVAPLEVYPLPVRIGNALLAYVAYLGKMLWPMNLAVFYTHHGAQISVAGTFAAGLFLIIFTGLILGRGCRWPYLTVGWLWYLGTLVPVIGLVQVGTQAMADRYTYVPLIGLFLMLVWGACDLASALQLHRFYLVAITIIVLSACGLLTWIQLGYWQSDVEFWKHSLAVNEGNAAAHHGLGVYFYKQGRWDDARPELERAVAIDPSIPKYHLNFGLALYAQDECEQALTEYQKALELDPSNAFVHTALANVLRDLDRREEAQTEYIQAIELSPEQASPHVGLGNVLADLGRREEAIDEYQRALHLEPDLVIARNHLALTLQSAGRLDEAQAEYRKASALGLAQANDGIQACVQLRALRQRYSDLPTKRYEPSNNAERLTLADFCGQPFVGLYVRSAQLYAEAFSTDPRLAHDPGAATHRINAAIASALAARGLGNDAAKLDEKERDRLRKQTLQSLQAELDLAAWTTPGYKAQARAAAQQALWVFRRHPAFSEVRDPVAVAKLSDAERARWQKLWKDISALAKASSQ
jgi:protein O-mannosyl-transferase